MSKASGEASRSNSAQNTLLGKLKQGSPPPVRARRIVCGEAVIDESFAGSIAEGEILPSEEATAEAALRAYEQLGRIVRLMAKNDGALGLKARSVLAKQTRRAGPILSESSDPKTKSKHSESIIDAGFYRSRRWKFDCYAFVAMEVLGALSDMGHTRESLTKGDWRATRLRIRQDSLGDWLDDHPLARELESGITAPSDQIAGRRSSRIRDKILDRMRALLGIG